MCRVARAEFGSLTVGCLDVDPAGKSVAAQLKNATTKEPEVTDTPGAELRVLEFYLFRS